MASLTGKYAIVTGGAMGNGKGIAEVLASQGARVAIFDKSDILDETVAELTGKGYDVCGFRTDITDRANIDDGLHPTRICEYAGEFIRLTTEEG